MVIRQPLAGGQRRGLPSLNVIGKVDIPTNPDYLLIDAAGLAIDPHQDCHGIKAAVSFLPKK
jgi:hypothetical protein